jgi:hypothetical protein
MRSRLFRGVALAVVLLAMAVVAPPSASAQGEDGVVRDPNSPAGTEYAIPFGRARDEASGRPSREQVASSEDAPVFGQGITPSGGSSTGSRPPATNRRRPAREQGAAGRPTARDARLATASATTPDSNTGWMLGVGLAVIAVGSVLGLGLRRLLRS